VSCASSPRLTRSASLALKACTGRDREQQNPTPIRMKYAVAAGVVGEPEDERRDEHEQLVT